MKKKVKKKKEKNKNDNNSLNNKKVEVVFTVADGDGRKHCKIN